MNLKTRLLTVALVSGVVVSAPHGPDDAALLAQGVDPCSVRASAATTSSTASSGSRPPKTGLLDHDDRWSHLDSLWAHRAAESRPRFRRQSINQRAAQDVGEIAVLQDDGEMITLANRVDLRDVGIRLTPNGSGGYDISRTAYGFRQPLGGALVLADDDTRELQLRFAFSFFGKNWRTTHCAVLRRSRSVIRRQGHDGEQRRFLHRDMVRRPGVRRACAGNVSSQPVERRRDRVPDLQPDDDARGGRGRVAGEHHRLHAGRSVVERRAPWRKRSSG
jgi:hypothetical protein